MVWLWKCWNLISKLFFVFFLLCSTWMYSDFVTVWWPSVRVFFILFCLYSLVWRQSWFWFSWLCSAPVIFVVLAYRFGHRVTVTVFGSLYFPAIRLLALVKLSVSESSAWVLTWPATQLIMTFTANALKVSLKCSRVDFYAVFILVCLQSNKV